MQLIENRRRRRADRTGGPRAEAPGRHRPKKLTAEEGPRFVIRHHVANGDHYDDHYDLCLEIDGVLASWAMPKSPSASPKDKRMARRIDDHPVQYATFEGAGGVIVWDYGTYANMTGHEMIKGLDRGHLSFRLRGRTVHGGYALTRIREGDDETWLMTKRGDGPWSGEAGTHREPPEAALARGILDDWS